MRGKSTHPRAIHWILFLFTQSVIAACQVTGGASSGINPENTNAHIPSSMLKVPVSRCAAHAEHGGDAPCPVSPSLAPPGTAPSAVPEWFQIVYAPSIGTQTPLVLNIANGTANGGESIILWPLQASRNELWQYTQSGQFVSGMGDYSYNTFTSSKSPAQPMVLSQINGIAVSEPSQTGTLEGGADQFQQWKITPNCLTTQCGSGAVIQNQLTGGYLVAASGTQNQGITLSSNPQAQWVFWPPRTLQIILNEPNSNFPAFTGSQLTAYNYISGAVQPSLAGNTCTYEGIALTGIRCQYQNRDATEAAALGLFLNQIDELSVPNDISASDWNAVVGQLTVEITDVELVQGLYDNYNDFYNGLFINNDATLNQMISDAGLTASSNQISGKGIAILEGMLYTAIEGIGGLATGGLGAGIGAIGNLTETAINGAIANGSVSQNNYPATVSSLWGKLSSDFINIQKAAGTNEASIVEDWGRLQAVGALIVSTGPDSLSWTSMQTPDLVAALQPGFEVTTMQMLLPAKYWLDPIPHVTNSNLTQYFSENYPGDDPPYYDVFESSIGNGVYNFSAIASGANNQSFVTPFPDQPPMQNDLFNNGVSKLALFNNLNGWNFPLSWTDWNNAHPYSIDSATGCNQLIVSVINQTGDSLNLFLTENHGSLLGSTPRGLSPYSTVQVGILGNTSMHGPDFNFCVTNASSSSCSSSNGNYVQFEVQQDHCTAEAGDITYKQSGAHLYQSSQLVQTTGSYANNIPGIVSVAIYNPSASQ